MQELLTVAFLATWVAYLAVSVAVSVALAVRSSNCPTNVTVDEHRECVRAASRKYAPAWIVLAVFGVLLFVLSWWLCFLGVRWACVYAFVGTLLR